MLTFMLKVSSQHASESEIEIEVSWVLYSKLQSLLVLYPPLGLSLLGLPLSCLVLFHFKTKSIPVHVSILYSKWKKHEWAYKIESKRFGFIYALELK